ncbi:hypothetical protein ACQP2T_28880 [Nonomuraea sp. CA-143628]|uniref:hypothetical protein n=1 Tax=Nonomuraea sp. CA-143628 TaxID=3239997 RepID=UPI003D8B26BA
MGVMEEYPAPWDSVLGYVRQPEREAAEGDTPWTVEDVTFLWEAADRLTRNEHSNYAELYRIPLAAVQRLDYPDRRQVLRWVPERLRDDDSQAWNALHEQIEQVLTEPPEHGLGRCSRTTPPR